MKPTLVIAMLLGLCLVASLTPVQAAPISAAMDAYVDNRGANADAPKGDWDKPNLYVYYANGSDVRPLVQFDVSSIPSGGSVASAILTLQVNPSNRDIGYGQTVSAYRVTTPWNDMFVTWNKANYSTPLAWTTPGGDYDAAVHGDYVSPGGSVVSLTTLSIDIAPIVQGWVNGTNPNYGVILTGSNGVLLNFYSMEVTGSGPTLDITMVPEPFSLALLAFGGLLLFKRR